MTGMVTVSSSELSAMRTEMTELRGTVALLTSQMETMMSAVLKMTPQQEMPKKEHLTEEERNYRISRQELQDLLGISERTYYRKIQEYGFISVEDGKGIKFILGHVVDHISLNGIDWHRATLEKILLKREVKPRYR